MRQAIGTVGVPPHCLGGLFKTAPVQIDTITSTQLYSVCVVGWRGGTGETEWHELSTIREHWEDKKWARNWWAVPLSRTGLSMTVHLSKLIESHLYTVGGLPHCLGLDCP